MSFAIIETGGKQYKVSASNILKIEKLNIPKGKKVEFKNFIPHFFVLIFISIISMIIIYLFKGSEKSAYEICQSLKT